MFHFPAKKIWVLSLFSTALSLFSSVAPAEAVTFNFFWTGNPTLNPNITSSADSTLQATGTVTINKLAGETFGRADFTDVNISVTGDSITPFTFTSWNPENINWETVGGQIASDGLSASFTTAANPFFANDDFSNFFGCVEFNCAATSDQFAVSGQYVSYNSQASALASFTMTATPVPLESNALPVVATAVFMGGGIWWKRRRAKAEIDGFLASNNPE